MTMKTIDRVMFGMYMKYRAFRDSERGDTNFVSMLLIIGIVVVLAGLFLSLGKNTMTSIGNKVNTFIKGL